MEIPKLPAIFTGTGDLFASLLLAWMQKHTENLQLACEKTMAAVQAVLKRTLREAQGKKTRFKHLKIIVLSVLPGNFSQKLIQMFYDKLCY